MALFNPEVRRRTDALDAAGNTTAAIGKVPLWKHEIFLFSYFVKQFHE